MKNIFTALALLLALFAATPSAHAQQPPIMVCNVAGTSCTPYYNLDTAYKYAAAGSWYYLPGGNFTLNDTLKKEVHFIGAGWDPDSTTATGLTLLAGDLKLGAGSVNSSFEGFKLSGSFVNCASALNNITILRCNFSSLALPSLMSSTWNNCTIDRCVCNNLHFGYYGAGIGQNNILRNSFINFEMSSLTTSQITNCNLAYIAPPSNITNCTFKNNIIKATSGSGASTGNANNILINNISSHPSFSGLAPVSETGSKYNQSASSLYVNSPDFDWAQGRNMKIQTSSPAHNGGDDGTDIGPYGSTVTPFTDGSVPSNPHIYFKNIGATTNAAGNLPVQIKVRSGN